MRRTAAALGAVLLVTFLPGCSDVNKGTAFANEFQSFLDGRDDLESAEAGGTNPLPWSGTLVDAGDCSWLPGATEVLALLAVPRAVTSYTAEHSELDDRPSIRITLARDVPVDVAPAQARAAELGVDLYFPRA